MYLLHHEGEGAGSLFMRNELENSGSGQASLHFQVDASSQAPRFLL